VFLAEELNHEDVPRAKDEASYVIGLRVAPANLHPLHQENMQGLVRYPKPANCGMALSRAVSEFLPPVIKTAENAVGEEISTSTGLRSAKQFPVLTSIDPER